MQNATALMTNIGQGKPTQPTLPTFDKTTVDATLYFFKRLRSIYGAAKFKKEWPLEVDEKVAKREWAKNIGKFNKEEIDQGFEYAKQMIEKGNKDYLWPNIGIILSGCKKTLCAAHSTLPAPKETEAEKEKQRAWAKQLEEMVKSKGAK